MLPRPEYPRPQLVRQEWLSLNGPWEFAVDPDDGGLSAGWNDGRTLEGQITVPFAYQTRLSGINDQSIHPVVWYARDLELPAAWHAQDILLHFGAVDYRTTVWVNGEEVGHNQGGQVPFSFDSAPYLKGDRHQPVERAGRGHSGPYPATRQAVAGRGARRVRLLLHDRALVTWMASMRGARLERSATQPKATSW